LAFGLPVILELPVAILLYFICTFSVSTVIGWPLIRRIPRVLWSRITRHVDLFSDCRL